MPRPASTPLPRIVARGRPASDPSCAGCPQLGLFRALRRAGLDIRGAAGCEPSPCDASAPASGRWAAVTGVGRVLASPGDVVRNAEAAGARVLVVADRATAADAHEVAALLAGVGARARTVDPGDLATIEAAACAAAELAGSALVALSACRRGARAGAPLAIAPARCNRCGACLGLGCSAILDAGGDAMEIDPGVCTGCKLCTGLCRARAIV